MNNNDIYRISHLINEDPDLIDDERGMLITYTNSVGETKQYRITRAWPRLYRRHGLIGYNVEWPNGTFGFLKLDGLSDESYELLGSQHENPRRAGYEYERIKRNLKKAKKTKKAAQPGTERRLRWNYMFKTYGRCCPKWFEPGHSPTVGDCWQADEVGKRIRFSAPDPHKAKLYDGTFLDGAVKIKQLGDDDWEISLSNGESQTFDDSDTAMEFLENNLSPPDLEELVTTEFHEMRYQLRSKKPQYSQPQITPETPQPQIKKTIESDYGPISITKLSSGNIEISMEGEEPIEFEDPNAASNFLRDHLGIDYLIEHKKSIPRVLSESIGPDDITRVLTELGYSNIEFVVPNDEEFQRLDVFGGVFLNDKLYQLGDPMTDISEEKLRQAIAKIEASGLKRELTDEDMEEIEELQNDSHLFVTASKQIGDKFVGITLMSLDDPNMQFGIPNWQGDDDDGDALSVDDLESMFNAPSFDSGNID